jgi:hypothetical protein
MVKQIQENTRMRVIYNVLALFLRNVLLLSFRVIVPDTF